MTSVYELYLCFEINGENCNWSVWNTCLMRSTGENWASSIRKLYNKTVLLRTKGNGGQLPGYWCTMYCGAFSTLSKIIFSMNPYQVAGLNIYISPINSEMTLLASDIVGSLMYHGELWADCGHLWAWDCQERSVVRDNVFLTRSGPYFKVCQRRKDSLLKSSCHVPNRWTVNLNSTAVYLRTVCIRYM